MAFVYSWRAWTRTPVAKWEAPVVPTGDGTPVGRNAMVFRHKSLSRKESVAWRFCGRTRACLLSNSSTESRRGAQSPNEVADGTSLVRSEGPARICKYHQHCRTTCSQKRCP